MGLRDRIQHKKVGTAYIVEDDEDAELIYDSSDEFEEHERVLKLMPTQIHETKQLYEQILSGGSQSLFFKEGMILARRIAEPAKKNIETFFETAAKLLKEYGWLEDVQFEKNKIVVQESIEVIPDSNSSTCHKLCGILTALHRSYYKTDATFKETLCKSTGHEHCIFETK